MDTDASATQIGAVLRQEQADGTTQPVGYWSRSLSPAEKNCSTTEREYLAVVWSSRLSRPYIGNTRFTVRTDDAALKWTLHMSGAHGRLSRWRLRLAELNYVVRTRPGASHHAADMMSRLSTTAEDYQPIRDALPCLALPNSWTAWKLTPQTARGKLSPLTLTELLEGKAADERCKVVRREIDGNLKSRFCEDANGLLVRVASLDGAIQAHVPTHMRLAVMMREHYPPQVGHPGANKMYTGMRRWFYWGAMVVDVDALVADCTECARNRVGRRWKTNYLKTFLPTEPLTELCMDVLGPLPVTTEGNKYLLIIVDRFSKLTRAIPLREANEETIAAAFLDYWVAAYGPPNTVLTDNGPQFRAAYFQGVFSFLGVHNRYSTTYHPQTSGQVERYNGTIVGQLRAYVEDHRHRWDDLVSMLTLAYNSKPQQSTAVAPLEFIAPEQVRTFATKRMVSSPADAEKGIGESPWGIRERIRTRLRNLVHKVRKSLEAAQRRYKQKIDSRVRAVNESIGVGDWVFVDSRDKTKAKLRTRVDAPYRVMSRKRHTFRVSINGYPEVVSSDHVTKAPDPVRDPADVAVGVPAAGRGAAPQLWTAHPRGGPKISRSGPARE